MVKLKIWNLKSPKTLELLLLIITIVGLSMQPQVIAGPVHLNSNSNQTRELTNQKITSTNSSFRFEWLGFSFPTITLPLVASGTYNFIVQWGDGSNNTITIWNQTTVSHTYTSANFFNVTITGVISGWEFNNAADVNGFYKVFEWGPLNLGNTGYYFYGATQMGIAATDTLNLTGTTNMAYAFANTGVGANYNYNFNQWNVSGVTDMTDMFYNDLGFNQSLNSWDVSHVTSMTGMFQGDYIYNQSLSTWNTKSVTNFGNMFEGDYYFNQPIGNWNTSSATSLNSMFMNDPNFNQPINNWDVSHVTNLGSLFQNDPIFNQSLSSWNTSSVTTLSDTFYGDVAFNQPLNSWNVSSVTYMIGTFEGDTYFNQPLNSWVFTTSSSGLYIFSLFENDISFNQPLNSWNVSNVIEMGLMFYNDTAFNQPLNSWDTSHVGEMSSMFQNDTSFNQPLNSWNVSQVTTMYHMFAYDTAFNQPLGSWNVSQVNDMTSMFAGDTLSYQNYDNLLNGWSTEPLYNGIAFDAGHSQYSNASATARQSIISSHGWSITDGGEYVLTAPQAITAQGGDTFVFLSWSAPNANGGYTITGYSVYQSTTNGTGYTLIATVGASTYTYNDTGLTLGQLYYFIISVSTASTSVNSSQITATPFSVPSAPLTVTTQAGIGFVNISWSVPISNGGFAITGYNIYRSTMSGSGYVFIATVDATTYSFNDSNVIQGQTYYYVVTANNSVGTGAYSTEVSVIALSTPSAPLSIQAQAGNGFVILSWSAPNNDGGSAITGYNIYRSFTSGSGYSMIANVNASTFSFKDINVTNGVTFYYVVSATNIVGSGINSTVVNAFPAVAPSAPQNLNAQAGNSYVFLSWSAPNSVGGSNVTTYSIYRSTTSGSGYTLISTTTGSTLSFTDTSVTNGQTYYYVVTATNKAGESVYSNEASATPINPNASSSSNSSNSALTISSSPGYTAISTILALAGSVSIGIFLTKRKRKIN